MSFLERLLGGTFESNLAEGEAMLAEGRFGDARMAFERALRKAGRAEPEGAERVRDRIRECRFELARDALRRADALSEEGSADEARGLLEEAAEISEEAEILEGIKERRDRYEAEEARRLVEDSEEMSEEEFLAVIAGTWTDPQAEEYATLPDSFREALLASHDGDHERAHSLLREIADAPDLAARARYVWLEIGRELAALDRLDEAIEALGRFVSAVEGDEESVDSQVAALVLRARAMSSLDRHSEAEDQLRRATEVAPDSHVTFLAYGSFLRGRGQNERALAALDKSAELMGQMHPDIRVLREMGFTYLAMERKREAEESFFAVVEHYASRGEHAQIDPETGVALASLYEERGEPMKAADIHRHLAVGHDTRSHFLYNLEAARLLAVAGADRELVERYFSRASELAVDSEQIERVSKERADAGTEG